MGNIRQAVRNTLRGKSAQWSALPILALLLLWPGMGFAQQQPEQEGKTENINGKDYNVKQSVEFGGRFVDISGNENLYDTFVNLQQGARLLGLTTEVRPLDNHGGIFDRFYLSSFGYGGDPNDVTRLRIAKNTWYNFDSLIRRDQNAWDYSLQANPLNPTGGFVNGPPGFGPLAASVCSGCILGNSPHLMDTRRYLGDYNLLVLPESKVRLRMGYSRNIVVGPAFTTLHLGTEQLFLQDVRNTVNTYRVGVDYRAAPRTNFSYDEIWNDYKGDTGAVDRNQAFALANGTPVDIGVSLNAAANQPCGGTFTATGAINPACSAIISYLTHGRVRTSTPTEQFSMQSNYWKPLDFTGRFSYTAGDAQEFNYLEALTGRESRTNLFNATTNGSVKGQRVNASADFGATWHITDAWRFLDSLHFSNFHNPMQFDSTGCSFFSTNMTTPINVFGLVGATLPFTCSAPLGSLAGNPAHNASSEPDLTLPVYGSFLKQQETTNLAEVDYQHSWRLGARIGFRYRKRSIDDNSFLDATEFFFPGGAGGTAANFFNAARGDCAAVAGVLPAGCTPFGTNGALMFVTPSVTLNPGSTEINEYSGLFGFWAKPVRTWRISFDAELMGADNVFTRISPRQSQEYRVRSVYKPLTWINIGGTVRIWEGRDNVFQVNNLQHDRAYGLTANFIVNEKLSIDLGYDYNDVFSQVIICYPGAPIAGGPNQCATVAGLVEQLSIYKNKSHYGNFDFVWTPVRTLTLHAGGNFTGTNGSALFINPNQESGPLDSKWLVPTFGLDYSFARNWTGRANWNYYGYHEDFTNVPQDIYAPRNFHANMVTLSVRYAF